MKPFHFSLQRVLEIRASKVDLEETKLGALRKELAGLETEIERVERARVQSVRALAMAQESRGEDLRALPRFCASLERKRAALAEKRSSCAQRLARQQQSYLQARTEYRLIEKLRETRLAEWTIEAGRELDKVAGELYLARWQSVKPNESSTRREGT
jgi:flagellar export protein FliJ